MVKSSFPTFLNQLGGWISRNLMGIKFSLKKRILLTFGILMCFAVIMTTQLVFQQHRNSMRNAQVALESRRQIVLSSQILDALSEIDQRVRLRETTDWDISKCRELIQSYRNEVKSSKDATDLLARLDSRFNDYVQTIQVTSAAGLRSRGPADSRSLSILRTRYQDVINNMNALIELNANATFHSLHDINLAQEKAGRLALYYLAIFILLSLIACSLMIGVVMRPLNILVDFLDRVNVEDDMPNDLPHLGFSAPELSVLKNSFSKLIQRLRGYRALNVRRLVIEKRRADIIAASISDAIFLLRGDEILYVNPVAQRMLESNRGSRSIYPSGGAGMAPVGMSLRSLAEGGGDPFAGQHVTQLEDGSGSSHGAGASSNDDDRSNRCARAILTSIAQTMPVEFELEERDKKSHFLIQAYPISYDLIEAVEHSVKGPLEQILDRFQANTIVVAQDVTIVRESQEAKGHFLATLSHEIKTPVTSLTMATRLLSRMVDEIPNPSHRNLILTCVEDVDRLRRLLDDLLTTSRFDLAIQRLEYQNIDFAKLLKNSVQSFQTQARQRDIRLTFTGQGKNLHVPMDPSKIAWAISNLLTNALRHTPRGGEVEARLVSTADDWIEVRVKDTGPGIDPKRQTRIFDKFSSYYDLRVARTGTTGAGLSIAREIVSAHGGRIWVTSEPGQGAEFGFTLPLKRKGPETGSGSKPGASSESSKQESVKMKKGAPSGASACG